MELVIAWFNFFIFLVVGITLWLMTCVMGFTAWSGCWMEASGCLCIDCLVCYALWFGLCGE